MLSQFLVSELFAVLLVFCRLGSALMLLPGFGELYVPVRVRLLLAIMFSVVVALSIPGMPAPPDTVFGTATLLIAEILTGLFLGGLSRLLISTVHMAGMVIAYQSSLASALTQDIALAQSQGTSLGNLLSVTALLLLFATDLHHVMLRGLVDSYSLILPGHWPPMNDFAQHVVNTMSSAFRMALQMAAPFIIIGLLIYLAAGIISKLMPNIQIFFILMAPQLLISFSILFISISAIMLWYLEYYKTALGAFLAPAASP